MVEKVVFWTQIFKIEFLQELHVLRSSESEIGVELCESIFSTTLKQIIAKRSKFGALRA